MNLQMLTGIGLIALAAGAGGCSASGDGSGGTGLGGIMPGPTPGNGTGNGNGSGSTGGGGMIVVPPGGTGGPWIDPTANTIEGPGDCNPKLVGIVRDFNSTLAAVNPHPDFQEITFNNPTITYGLVQPRLGPDGAPQYADPQPPGLVQLTSKAFFDLWYAKTHPASATYQLDLDNPPASAGLTRTRNGNTTTYESTTFFPIDGVPSEEPGYTDAWSYETGGNGGTPHNYHFTFELQTKFKYEPGQVFRFYGDDDLWVFINGWLVVDVGGLHAQQEGSVELDRIGDPTYVPPVLRAPDLSQMPRLVPGQEYSLAVFHAERHTTTSNFQATTNIQFTNCEVIQR